MKFRSIFTNEKRFVKKVFKKETINEFAEIKGEIVLRETGIFENKYQVSAIVYSIKDTNLLEFTLQKFTENQETGITTPIHETAFSFSQEEFTALLKFLSDLKFLDFSNKERFVIEEGTLPNRKILLNLTKPDPSKVLVDKELADIVDKLSDLEKEKRESVLETLRNNVLTKEDLNILSGRKEGLELFSELLEKDVTEPEWQLFFKQNSWIFGYGLDYRFLSILQREASVSSTDLDGKNEVKSDYLLADKNFTVLVELKRPDTALFEKDKNRSESWKLSKDLTYAVSQILAQKAEWEIKSQTEQFDGVGNKIKQKTFDPKTILITGNTNQFSGSTKTDLIKKKTFELYRRNSRNIEILTYDELFARATFIVNDGKNNEQSELNNESDEEYDDLPF
ncbi:Shedu immune nuclease family protein [Kordia periserrulae]|uniref:Shedu immune nuclease family protein n=1 Tax=Kordia periserrulae TaxID=701523 RepID=UPI001304933F|nr:Shedu immune nuclease family protein [Kordia periserrulae]